MDIYSLYTIETNVNEGKTTYIKACVYCGNKFKTNRIHKLTCCNSCYQKHRKRQKKGLPPHESPPKKKPANE